MNAGGFSIANDGSGGFWVSNSQHLRHRNANGSAAIGDGEIPWNGVINALGSDGHGRVWAGVHEVGTFARIFEHNSGGWHPLQTLPGLRKSSDIQSIFVDKEGSMWIGTSDLGLYRVAGSSVDRFDQSDGLSNNSISDITQDAEGSIWIATSGGIDQLHRSLVDSWSTREGLSGDSVSAIVADRAGRIWMSNTGGLDVLENGSIRSYRPGAGLPGATVTGLQEDRQGRLWVGIDHRLWILENGKFQLVPGPDGKEIGQVVMMALDAGGKMWIKTSTKHLFRFSNGVLENVNWKYAGVITSMYADQTGMWVGARGVLAIHIPSDATSIDSAATPVTDSKFGSLFQLDGKVIGLTQYGLAVVGRETTSTLNQRNGLEYQALLTSALSSNGDLYLMTERSYLQITAQDLARWLRNPDVHVPSRVIDGRDGAVAGNATFGPSSAVAPNGDVWFATDRFPQRIDPQLLSVRHPAPMVQIQSVMADGVVLADHPIVLKAGTHNLEIHYAALSYINPRKVEYRYLLEGFDTDWQNAGSLRQAVYKNLPPGRYRFRVAASDADRGWTSKVSDVDFRLVPHFYQTRWFEALLVFGGLCLIWIIYLARLRYLIQRTKEHLFQRMSERERIARDLHDTFF